MTGVEHIPTEQRRDSKANEPRNLLAACLHPDMPERFVLFNDDFYVMQPTASMPTLHRGPLADMLRVLPPVSNGLRLAAAHHTLTQWGMRDALAYDLIHVPLTLNRDATAAILTETMGHRASLAYRTLAGNRAHLGGERARDHKIRSNTDRRRWRTWAWLSTSPTTWAGRVGEYVRTTHAQPSTYE